MSGSSVSRFYGRGGGYPTTAGRPSPLRIEIPTENFRALGLEDGERTPTQADFPARGVDAREGAADDVQAVYPVMGQGGIVVGGRIQKSASNMDLRALASEDESFDSSVPGASDFIHVASNHPAKQVIDAINRVTAINKARGYADYLPREDRGPIPDAKNAQGLFSPDANVFVANLPTSIPEDELERACHSVLDNFGRNYVKIKWDKNEHPFALVQFETIEAAKEAIANAHGRILDGRQIRIEQSKVERGLVIYRPDGGFMTEDEAREVLSPFGAVDFLCPTSVLRGRAGHIPDGIYVRFAFYLDCRDALKGFSCSASRYRVQSANGVEPSFRRAQYNSSFSKNLTPPRSITDCRSVFVGNLPEDATKDDLNQIFGQFGPIVDSNVVTKTYASNSQNCFGFVEFPTAAAANTAASFEQYLRGNKLRIEPKEYSSRRASRLNDELAMPGTTSSSVRTPLHISPAANAALARRLAYNEVSNTVGPSAPPPSIEQPLNPGYSYTPEEWQPPRHYPPPQHLFSSPGPAPPPYPPGPHAHSNPFFNHRTPY